MQQPGRPVSGPARGSSCRRLLRSSSCACSVALVRRSRRRQSFSAAEEGAPALLQRNTRQQAPFHNLYEEIGRPSSLRRCHGTPAAMWLDRALRSWTLTRRRRSMSAARFFFRSRPKRRCTNRRQWRRHPPVSFGPLPPRPRSGCRLLSRQQLAQRRFQFLRHELALYGCIADPWAGA